MSRSGYSDDCSNLNLYRGNMSRMLSGRKGQTFLKELLAALDAIEDKRLISHELIRTDEDNEGAFNPRPCGVCAMGSVGVARGMDMSEISIEDSEQVGMAFGVHWMLAAEVEYINDEYFRPETDEERWQRVHNWVEAQIPRNLR